MENNLVNKAKFMAQYFRQVVLMKSNNTNELRIVGLDLDSRRIKYAHFLLLKPLSSITDEDATKLGEALKWVFPDLMRDHILENHLYGDSLEQLEVDFLRSKGYALPYMALSVEKLIEYGWIKLNNG